MLGVGIVGAGGIGARRAGVAAAAADSRVVAVYDVDAGRAAQLAAQVGAVALPSLEALLARADVDVAVVATTHDALAAASIAALEAGKHVLCEKPVGRNPAEVRAVVAAAARAGRCVKGGYNHRYHPAIRQVHAACVAGQIGPLLHLRARYGHGGRPGYDREWRADPVRAGGGELLDQGAHLVDLAGWLLGPFAEVTGYVSTSFWDMELEDNAFGLLRTPGGQVASFHVSWTQWRNLFSLEVFGRDGYAVAEGLGRSYGPERAVVGFRPPAGGVPREQQYDFPEEDTSWALEWEDFTAAIRDGSTPMSSGAEALQTMEWIYRLYAAAATGRRVLATESPWDAGSPGAPPASGPDSSS